MREGIRNHHKKKLTDPKGVRQDVSLTHQNRVVSTKDFHSSQPILYFYLLTFELQIMGNPLRCYILFVFAHVVF